MSSISRLIRTSSLCAVRRHPTAANNGQFLAANPSQSPQATASFSSSSDSDSFYKVVKSKIRLDDETDFNSSEGGPNWELFAPRGNRFFLPGSLGPAWQGTSTTAAFDPDLEQMIDFDETDDPKKLHISTKQCPVLLRSNLHELFPAPEVYNKGPLTMITLTSRHLDCVLAESGAKTFVLLARAMCTRLRMHGYWADFMNPFSGKPFHSYASGKNLYKVDARFRGLGMRFEEHDACLVISSALQQAASPVPDENTTVAVAGVDADASAAGSAEAAPTTTAATTMIAVPFSGNVFTTAPVSLQMLQALVVD